MFIGVKSVVFTIPVTTNNTQDKTNLTFARSNAAPASRVSLAGFSTKICADVELRASYSILKITNRNLHKV